MTDRELLELAAKAAGITGEYKPQYFCGNGPNDCGIYIINSGWVWNPLTNDGDALRLAVKLGIGNEVWKSQAWAWVDGNNNEPLSIEELGDDPSLPPAAQSFVLLLKLVNLFN